MKIHPTLFSIDKNSYLTSYLDNVCMHHTKNNNCRTAEHEKSCSLWFETEGTKRQTWQFCVFFFCRTCRTWKIMQSLVWHRRHKKTNLTILFRFFLGRTCRTRKTMQSVCFDREPHKAQKNTNWRIFVAGHRKTRQFCSTQNSHKAPKKKHKLDDNFIDCRTCRTWKTMQSCSTQNHTRGSWHQTELVRADLGSLMRWARARAEDWVGPCEGLAALSSPGSSKSMIVAQKQSKSKQASTSTYPTAHCTVIHGWCCSCCCCCCCCLLSFLHSFLMTSISLFVTAKKPKNKTHLITTLSNRHSRSFSCTTNN